MIKYKYIYKQIFFFTDILFSIVKTPTVLCGWMDINRIPSQDKIIIIIN